MQCTCAILSSAACPALQYFATLSHKRYHFQKKVIEHNMYVLIFSTTFGCNISHCKKNCAKYDKKCILVYMPSTCYSCSIFMKFQFSQHIFEKCSNTKFHENPSGGSHTIPCRETDRQTHMTKLTVTFHNFLNTPKNLA